MRMHSSRGGSAISMPTTATGIALNTACFSVDVEQPATSCHCVKGSRWDLVAPRASERAGPAAPTQGSARLVGLDLERAQT